MSWKLPERFQMRFNRRRRWRRLAIALSAIWFVGFAMFVWFDGFQSNTDFLHGQLGACLTVLDRAGQGLQDVAPIDRADRRSANWTKFKSCEASAEVLFNQMSEDQGKAVPLVLTVDFVTVLIGWLAVGLVVLIVRRIGRGFAPGWRS